MGGEHAEIITGLPRHNLQRVSLLIGIKENGTYCVYIAMERMIMRSQEFLESKVQKY